MKKLLLIISLAAVTALNAQESPLVFHNHLEYITYQLAHPERVPSTVDAGQRWITDYTLKLDSVVGSDNFDMKRWKNLYDYHEMGKVRIETNYEWQNQAWTPVLRTEIQAGEQVGDPTLSDYYRWNGEDWELYYKTTCEYVSINGLTLVESLTAESLKDSVWVGASRSVYEYDANGQMTLNMNYNGQNSQGAWQESSKTECVYEDNCLIRRLYSTIRNGSWRESRKDSLVYNGNQQCVSMLSYSKGGMGPGGGTWRLGAQYDFNYVDGVLESETIYSQTDWFSGTLSLYLRTNYEFDANGNELRKTGSVFNEVDWIVRDEFVNRYDYSVAADQILGLAPVWESTVNNGLGNTLGDEMPLHNLWLSCAIACEQLDSDFSLYYSDFSGVDETRPDIMRVYMQQGHLCVENEEAMDVTVYDLTGRVVAQKSQTTHGEFALRPGIYIVGNGKGFVKAVVH